MAVGLQRACVRRRLLARVPEDRFSPSNTALSAAPSKIRPIIQPSHEYVNDNGRTYLTRFRTVPGPGLGLYQENRHPRLQDLQHEDHSQTRPRLHNPYE